MPSTITAEKAALRTQIRARLKALPLSERQAGDALLFQRFLSLPQTAAASTLLLYHGMGTEPDTARLIPALLDRGKQVLLPRCLPGRCLEARRVTEESALIRHRYGMLEPGEDCPLAARESIDLILVPGLCFDRLGYRLGQGGGYYDRYLAGYAGSTVGLCRRAVLQEAVPREAHDRPVDLVVTDGEPVPG